jgi:hypothetical protein
MRTFEDFPLEEAGSASLSDRPTAIHSAPEQLRLVEDSCAHVMRGALASNSVAGMRPSATPALESGSRESDFWSSGPRYSRTSAYPEIALSLPPSPKPSLVRRVFAKLLFVALFSAALALLAYEASIVFGFSWAQLLNG